MILVVWTENNTRVSRPVNTITQAITLVKIKAVRQIQAEIIMPGSQAA